MLSDLGQGLAEESGALHRSRFELLGQLGYAAGPALHRLAHDLAYVVEAGEAARRIRYRARHLGKADPAADEQQLWHPLCPVYPDEAGALAATFPRNKHIHEIRSSRAQVMAAHRGRSGEQAAPAPSSRTGRRSAPAPHRAPASQYARAPSIRPTGPKRTTAMPHRRGPAAPTAGAGVTGVAPGAAGT